MFAWLRPQCQVFRIAAHHGSCLVPQVYRQVQGSMDSDGVHPSQTARSSTLEMLVVLFSAEELPPARPPARPQLPQLCTPTCPSRAPRRRGPQIFLRWFWVRDHGRQVYVDSHSFPGKYRCILFHLLDLTGEAWLFRSQGGPRTGEVDIRPA